MFKQKMLVVALAACGVLVAQSANAEDCNDLSDLEAQMHAKLNNVVENIEDSAFLITNPSFTFMLQSANGYKFTHNRGTFTPAKTYSAASMSKMVTAAVLLDLVKEEKLSLESTPWIVLGGEDGDWAKAIQLSIDEGGLPETMKDMTLKNLLSLTSGLNDDPACLYTHTQTFEECVMTLPYRASLVAGDPDVPDGPGVPGGSGGAYVYGSSHMQVAGLMAMKVLNLDTWTEVFNRFKNKYSVFPNSVYELPTADEAVLAAGMKVTTEDFMDFLVKLYQGLPDESDSDFGSNPEALLSEMTTNHTDTMGLSVEDDREMPTNPTGYGLGVWFECGDGDCSSNDERVNSAGAFGGYPFMDFNNRYVGVLGRVGTGGFLNYTSFGNTIKIYSTLGDLPDRWANSANSCLEGPAEPVEPTLDLAYTTFWWGYRVQLSWENAEAVDVYKDGTLHKANVSTNPFQIAYYFTQEHFEWKVCEAGTDNCSVTQQ